MIKPCLGFLKALTEEQGKALVRQMDVSSIEFAGHE